MVNDRFNDVDSCEEHRRKNGLVLASDDLKCAKQCLVAATCKLRSRVIILFDTQVKITRAALAQADYFKKLKP